MNDEIEKLGSSYLNLRALIPGAFDTPYGSPHEQVYEITEAALNKWHLDTHALMTDLILAIMQLKKFLQDAPSLDYNEDITLTGISIYTTYLNTLTNRYKAYINKLSEYVKLPGKIDRL